jgi:catechol 2,3-dioxygenase-like lactoylglutathione lyase family enzyme
MSENRVKAVLFVKDLRAVAQFYSSALGMSVVERDEHHWRLSCAGFELVVHQIPKHIADTIVLERPPTPRVWAAIRLDYPVHSIAECRRAARAQGGYIDDKPPAWAEPDAKFFFGYDPEGNQFGVSENAQ